jgi:hypothetical protein
VGNGIGYASLEMKLIDGFYQDGVIDCYTWVLDDRDPRTGSYTMLATDSDGVMFSQWTEGQYEPAVSNSHLGERPRLMSERLVKHILARMSDE